MVRRVWSAPHWPVPGLLRGPLAGTRPSNDPVAARLWPTVRYPTSQLACIGRLQPLMAQFRAANVPDAADRPVEHRTQGVKAAKRRREAFTPVCRAPRLVPWGARSAPIARTSPTHSLRKARPFVDPSWIRNHSSAAGLSTLFGRR